jgi:AcrR family transcriptional regulator
LERKNILAVPLPSPGKSIKGQQTSLSILLSAEKLITEQGYHNFSLRKIADTAELTLGNLQYYFPNKDALMKAMLDNCIQRYLDRFEQLRLVGEKDPEAQLKSIIKEVLLDLNKKTTTYFFPEIWSLANHNQHADEFMDQMYERYRITLTNEIAQLNPELNSQQLKRLAIFITSSIEGHTMFIGYKKPFEKETDNIIEMACQSFLWLIRSGKIPE